MTAEQGVIDAVAHARGVLAAADGDPELARQSRLELADALYDRFHDQSRPGQLAGGDDLYEALRHVDELASTTGDQDPFEIRLLITTAFLLTELAELEESPARLTEAIRTFEVLVDKTWLPSCLPELGRLLLVRYELEPDANSADLDRAIEVLRMARPADDPAPETSYLLGTALTMRLGQRDIKSVDWRFEANEAIEVLSSIPPSPELDELTETHTSFQLGHLANMRHTFGRDDEDDGPATDLDEAISRLRYSADDDTRTRFELACALSQRYYSAGCGPGDREEAIEHLERICADQTEPTRYSVCGGELCDLYADRVGDENAGDREFDEARAAIEDLLRRTEDDDGTMRISLAQVLARRRPPRREELARLVEVIGELLDSGIVPPESDSGLPEIREMAIAEMALADGSPAQLDAAREALYDMSRTTLPDDWSQLVALEACAVLIARRAGIRFDWPLMMVSADFHAFDHVHLLEHIRAWCAALPAGTPGYAELLAARAMVGAQFVDELTESSSPDQVGAEIIGHLREALAVLSPDDGLRVGLREQLAVRLATAPGATEADYESAFGLLAEIDAELPAGHPMGPRIAVHFGALALDAHNLLGVRIDLQEARERVQIVVDDPDTARDSRPQLLLILGFLKAQLGGHRRSVADLNAAVLDFAKALRLIPAGGRGRADVHAGLAMALSVRLHVLGDRADLDYCRKHIRAAEDALAHGDRGWMSIDALGKLSGYIEATEVTMRPARADDPAGVTQISAEGIMGSMTSLAAMVHAGGGQGPEAVKKALADAVAYAAEESTTGPLGSLARKWHQLIVLLKAGADEDAVAFDEAFSRVLEPLPPDDPMPDSFRSVLDGLCWNIRALYRDDGLARDQAVANLEQALLGTADALGQDIVAETLSGLYRDRRAPGDHERALELSREILRSRARSVLVQSSTAARLDTAARASAIATSTALQCLDAGRRADAVEVLEAGRALSLYAATSASTVRELLTRENRPDLAEAWRRETSGGSDAEGVVPDDLRHRALEALANSAAERQLLNPPDHGAIAQTLRDVDADHLVYLIPGEGSDAGRALSVSRDFRLRSLKLPGLTTAERAKREGDLGALCAWAWDVAIGPLDEEIHFGGDGEPARIVLVPCGALGSVPWHAACRTVDGGSRPFLADAVVSYAASARQFIEVAHRPRLPLTGRVVYIVDPGEPSFLESEGEYLRATCYPHAELYGRESPGSAERATGDVLLGALPGEDGESPAVLHLTCHGESGSLSSRSAFLLDGATVTVDEVLRHARGRRRGAPGGLVVAAACQSDLTLDDHDEALTLTTALLATGATTVVGTKWAIPNLASTVLTIQFHRELALGGRTPADALRAAQLWALDPHRKPPEGLPPALRQTAASARLAEPENWAAFTVHGR